MSDEALQYPCGSCFALPGQHCRSRGGKAVSPHKYRLADGYLYLVGCDACGATMMAHCVSYLGSHVNRHHARLKTARSIFV